LQLSDIASVPPLCSSFLLSSYWARGLPIVWLSPFRGFPTPRRCRHSVDHGRSCHSRAIRAHMRTGWPQLPLFASALSFTRCNWCLQNFSKVLVHSHNGRIASAFTL